MTYLEDVRQGCHLTVEMRRIERRVEAYLAAREGRCDFREEAARLAEERLALRDARARAAKDGVVDPFEALVQRHGLGPVDEDLLMLCLAPHLSQIAWGLLLHAQGSALKPYLEVGFLLELVCPAGDLVSARQHLASTSPLVASRLLRLTVPSEGGSLAGFLQYAVSAPDYLAAYITGQTTLDERLDAFARLETAEVGMHEVVLADKTCGEVEAVLTGASVAGGAPWSVVVTGPRQGGRTLLARMLASSLGRPLLTLELELLPKDGDVAPLVRLAADNAAFLGAVVHLDKPEAVLLRRPELRGPVEAWLRSHPGLVVIECDDQAQLPATWGSAIHRIIELPRPGADERAALWQQHLAHVDHDRTIVGELAQTWDLVGGQITHAIQHARHAAERRGEPRLLRADLEAGALAQLRGRLGDFTDASKVELRLTDLVLPDEPMQKVKELIAACRARTRVLDAWGFGRRLATGKGLVALFAGEAGTGKTLTAEILAAELGMSLHIVSIPKIVSKWVGETEQNIRSVFQHARAHHAVLLFDEADSLFTKRVAVERAQDHFQNMEVNLLLQEVERFEGIVLLTTNLEANMDKAFQRRILFRIDFPTPGPVERARIWKTLIPREAPREGRIDYEALGHALDLTGGLIKNAVLRAAYAACAADRGLSHELLLDSGRREAQAAGKLVRLAPEPTRARVPTLDRQGALR
ncbi:MAG: AAA family ATPase [Deltaproteobacteria bacterium]|nr:AAA family ATPase [Deltaproteobacteria bacterium]